MEMGESVKNANKIQVQDKCVVCSKKHTNPKKEKIQSTVSKPGWERDQSLTGVFDSGDAQRTSIYPGVRFPPPYPTEGHHCLALTSFIKKNKDRCVRLNHFLNKVGFQPNQPANILQLPDRHGQVAPGANSGMAWPKGVKKEYKSYWVSIDLGKPLQLHTGRHAATYFKFSDALYTRMMGLAYDVNKCQNRTSQDFEERLKKLIKAAVNYAFIQVAQATWVCHPEHLRIATSLYGQVGRQSHTYAHSSGWKEKVEHVGYPGKGTKPPPYQKGISLETTPF